MESNSCSQEWYQNQEGRIIPLRKQLCWNFESQPQCYRMVCLEAEVSSFSFHCPSSHVPTARQSMTRNSYQMSWYDYFLQLQARKTAHERDIPDKIAELPKKVKQ